MSDEMLALNEQNRLTELERKIETGLKMFVDVGLALLEIREGRLYRATHGTFEGYCKDRWEFSSEYARLNIKAAEVISNLSKTPTIVGVLPTTESQARPLAKLEPDEQREVWQRAVDTAPNGKVTAAHVAHIAKEYKQEVEQPEPEEPFLPDDENKVLYEDPSAGPVEAPEPSGFDPSIHKAYCKYCYETHSDWEASIDHSEPAWYCEKCEHATADRFLDFEPIAEVRKEEDTEPKLSDFEQVEQLVNKWWDSESAQTGEKYRKELWNTMVRIDRERGRY